MANTRRTNLRDIANDQLGNIWVGASVYVFAGGTWNLDDPPTGTAISGSVYATEVSALALTNPVATTGSQGEYDLWFSIPQQVDIVVADNSNAAIPSGGSAESFTPVRETYEVLGKNPTYVAGTARHEQGVAKGLGATVTESPQFVFVDSQVGSDSYPVGRRGTHDYPYATLPGPITDADYYDAGGSGKRRPVYVWVRGSPYVAADYTGAGPPPTYSPTPDQTFTLSSTMTIPKGWTYNLGWGDGNAAVTSCLVIPANGFTASTALIQTGQMSTLIGGTLTNTATGGIGITLSGMMARVFGTLTYFCQSDGIQIASFADDLRTLERIQSINNGQSGTGYGVKVLSSNSHSPNQVIIKDSDISTNYGSGNIHLQRLTGETGGQDLTIQSCRIHGNRVKIFSEGYRNVTIKGCYGEPSNDMTAPHIKLRCANGGTATALTDWNVGWRMEGNSVHGFANDGTQSPNTTTSGATGTGATANNITSTATFPSPPFMVLFSDGGNSEYMYVTSMTATTLTGTRAVNRFGPAFSHGINTPVRVVSGLHYDIDSCIGGKFEDYHFGVVSTNFGPHLPLAYFGFNTSGNYIDLSNAYNESNTGLLGDPAILVPASAEVPSIQFIQDIGYVTLPATTPRNWGIYHDATSLRLLQGGQDMGSYP